MTNARLISITMLLTLSGMFCCGQVSVVGHVSAEVVESVSASCISNTDMALNVQELRQFDIGEFSISGRASSTCTLIIDHASISNSRGDSFTIQTTTANAEMPMIADQNGTQSLTLIAGTDEMLAKDQYRGNYGVTFAYN